VKEAPSRLQTKQELRTLLLASHRIDDGRSTMPEQPVVHRNDLSGGPADPNIGSSRG
jgi:hypothetical protein